MKTNSKTLAIAYMLLTFSNTCYSQSDEADVTKKIHGNTYTKPGAPVTLKHQAPNKVSIGEQFTIQVELSSTTQGGRLELRLNVDQGLTILSQNLLSFDLPSNSMKADIILLGNTNGSHHLNLMALEVDTAGQPLQSRSFAIAIPIGIQTKSLTKKSNVVTDDGESIIEMIAD